jgi:hypothetical protein
MAAPKLPLYKTPKGVAIYPHLNKPDTRFNPDGQYQVKLRIPTKEAEDLIATIDAAIAAELAKAKKENPKKAPKEAVKPYAVALDDEGNETDETIFSFKAKAVVKLKDGGQIPVTVKLFDAKGGEFPRDEPIWGGSELKIAFNAVPYTTAIAGSGVSLRIKAAQVINLVSGGGGTASAFGFEQEDGYVAPTKPAASSTDADELETDEEESDF